MNIFGNSIKLTKLTLFDDTNRFYNFLYWPDQYIFYRREKLTHIPVPLTPKNPKLNNMCVSVCVLIIATKIEPGTACL